MTVESTAPRARTTPEGILAAVAGIAGSLAEGASERDLSRQLPWDAVEAVRRTGLPALRVPAQYGGPDGTLRDVFTGVMALARADSNLAQGLRSHFGVLETLVARALATGDDRWLSDVLDGRLLGMVHTERGVVDPAKWTTRLRPGSGDTLLLSGTKYYSTGALYADLLTVSAIGTDGRVTTVLVPADRDGITRLDDFDAMGQRCTASGTTTFEDVRVEPDEVLDAFDWHDPDRPLHPVGAFHQLYLAAVSAGIAQNVFDDATHYVRHKSRQAMHSVADSAAGDPYILQAVGEIGSLAFAAEAVVLHAADSLEAVIRSADADQDAVSSASIDVAKAQIVAERAAVDAAERLFDTGGASATAGSLNLSRHWRNARTVASHNPLAYKARATGDWAVNGTTPPRSGFF